MNNEKTFLEKIEEAENQLESWPEWKKKMYERLCVPDSKNESEYVVHKFDEAAFKAKFMNDFNF